jgi:hypothetical protein
MATPTPLSDGPAWVNQRLAELQRQVDELRGSVTTEDATIQTDVATTQTDVGTINTVTIPAIQTDVGVINDVTIPAVRNIAEQAATDATALQGKFPITATDISDGAISTPKLDANAIDGMTITGALIRTAATGQRVEISSPNTNQVRFFSGAAGETVPGAILSDAPVAGEANTVISSPTFSGVTAAELQLRTNTTSATAYLIADEIQLNASGRVFVDGSRVLTTTNTQIVSNKTLAGAKLGTAGNVVNGMQFGQAVAVPINTNGQAVIPHTLGVVPSVIHATAVTGFAVRVQGWTATNFTLVCYTLPGAALSTSSTAVITVNWIAIV